MKENFKLKKMFYALAFGMLFLMPFTLQAQCPFGEKVNCTGECGRFYDENGDSFCDNGLVQKEETITETITTQVEEVKPKQEVKKQEEKPVIQQEIKVEEPTITTQTQTEQIAPIKTEIQPEKKKTKKPYNIILITSIVLLAYLLTFILVKAGKLKKLSHRKIWNVILLVTFLVSCLLGFLLALQINYGFCMDWFRSFLKWHVEFGIAMTLIAVIHIVWHYKYYTTMISKKK
jgi:cation transport ATPase